ncbi:zinc finger, CCHC-type containing protein [Tanacetum coccineum]
MVVATMKHMASNFAKLDKFEGVDFRRWQKKIHFLLSSMSVVYVLTTHILEDGESATMEQIKKRNKWENDDYVCKDLILNEAKYMVEDASSKKFLEELTLVELSSHVRIKESIRVQDSDKPKDNNIFGPSVVNMVEHNNSTGYTDNNGKHKHQDTKTDPNKKSKVTCWTCGKPGHLKKDCKGGKVGNKANGSGINGSDDDVAWWVESRETVHVCKDRYWFKNYESLNDGSILYMENESTALVHRRGCVDIRFSSGKIVSLFNVLHVPSVRKNLVSSSVINK